jgi:predicted  nucleic acid-binding Zn-ribbon protein
VQPAVPLQPAAQGPKAPAATPAASPDDKNRRLNPIKLRQMKDRSRGIEDEITRLEVEIADLELALANFVSVEQTVDLNDLLTARRKDLENLMAEWEEVEATIQANR